jgi:hypothetical protein
MIVEIYDAEEVNSIYNADGIAARVGHDHRKAEYIAHPAVRYFGAYVEGKLVGAFVRIESTWVEVEVHAALTRAAIAHSRTLGREFIALMFSDPAIHKLSAPVFEGLESAANYCKRLGFKTEGFRRDCFMRGGKLVGAHMLGLTRRDYERNR